ncbi:MAG: ABC transporter ATP-binding protein [Erysipelothrix sp.]|nr:ABC transporter ATP-binding protein [Erysipelothrix sp.]
MSEQLAIEMIDVTKIYPNGVVANRDVNFRVKKGEIHALMGENGAGKSTLMKILFGMEKPTHGEIYVNGDLVDLSSPHDAISKGVGMVHQHFMLVPSLTVAENIVLGMVPRKKGVFIDFKEAIKITQDYSRKYNLPVDPFAKVADIPVGMKQKVEILKALVRGAEILILDEPTAVLTTQETRELFIELKNLKEKGFTIIFISHKLNEIMEITDRMTILKDGKSVGIYETKDSTPESISRAMVGRDVVLGIEKEKSNPTDTILKVRNLNYVNAWNKQMLKNVSFSLRKGEILGVAGVEGNGQKELVDALFNFIEVDSGEIEFKGESILNLSQGQLRSRNISLVPEDRMLFGIAANASVKENIISDRSHYPKYNKGPLFNMSEINKDVNQLVDDFLINCSSLEQNVGMLSGGNIQKVVVAREFSSNPELIIADQPTRGIDVGATEFIRSKLIELSRSGAGVLLISADLNEVMELSDSLIIMSGGEIVAYFEDTKGLEDDEMGRFMLGIDRQEDSKIQEVCYE